MGLDMLVSAYSFVLSLLLGGHNAMPKSISDMAFLHPA